VQIMARSSNELNMIARAARKTGGNTLNPIAGSRSAVGTSTAFRSVVRMP
jgi:hypothetical protein